jgi:hypothetical protein
MFDCFAGIRIEPRLAPQGDTNHVRREQHAWLQGFQPELTGV